MRDTAREGESRTGARLVGAARIGAQRMGVPRIALALVLLIAAALLPPIPLSRATYDYVVTFDITQSMNVADMRLAGEPVSRLGFARAALHEVLERLPCGSKVGWSYFTDYRSYTLLVPIEVCANFDVLLSALDQIDGRMRWANASNIARGVYWARRNAQAVPGSDVVFISDGQEAPPLSPGTPPMPDLDLPRVDGWLVGVGADTPSRIPKSQADGRERGYWTAEEVAQDTSLPPGTSHEHLSELRQEYLKSLAAQTGLRYVRLAADTSLAGALLDARFAHRTRTPTDVRWVPAGLALLLLLWQALPARRGTR